MRFFDINYGLNKFPGTATASSQSENASSCFDNLTYTSWLSNGEDTDGDAVYVERDLLTSKAINRIMVIGTNISDISLEYHNGSIFTALSATEIKSADNTNVLFEFTDPSASRYRIIGEDTIITNEEKEIQEIYMFQELGQLTIPPNDIKPKRIIEQSKHKLINAKNFYFNIGRRWEIDLKFKAHLGQTDIDLIESLILRDLEFHAWINDDEESVMLQKMEPFRFKDILKVAVDKGSSPSYYNNLFFSGVNETFKLVEVS